MKDKVVNNEIVKRRNKRGKRNSAKSVIKSLIFAGMNPDGAKSKMTTIKRLIRESKATVISMQETKLSNPGQLQFDGFFTYEHNRKNRDGGGVALSALKELNPAFVCDGGEDAEAVTVDIHLKSMAISVTSAYGPQNNAPDTKKAAFWNYLSEQAYRSKSCGKGFILQGDLNSWLGSDLLPGDKKPKNNNGRLFESFLEDNKLTCVNSLPITKGLVTRTRKYLGQLKQSTIDFYVVCERVLPYILSMKIVDSRHHTLTNYSMLNKKAEAVSSDHAPMIMEVKLEAVSEKKLKIEIPNFEDKESQLQFKKNTSETNLFTQCFNTMQPVWKQSEVWLSHVKTHIKKSFKNIRIRSRRIKPSASDRLIGQRNKLLKQGKTQEAKIIDGQIAKVISEEGRNKALMFKKYCDRNESNVLSEMWKLKKKLFPKKASTLPSAKINYKGELVTEPKQLTKLIGEEYGRVRLRKRPTHPSDMKRKSMRKKLLQLKIQLASQRKSPPF